MLIHSDRKTELISFIFFIQRLQQKYQDRDLIDSILIKKMLSFEDEPRDTIVHIPTLTQTTGPE